MHCSSGWEDGKCSRKAHDKESGLKIIGRHKRGLTGNSQVIADCINGATGVITDSEHF